MTFVRPEWLWLFIALVPVTFLWLKRAHPKTNWQHVIDADLYQAIAGNLNQTHRNQRWLLPLMLALTIIAAAGPALNSGSVQTSTQGNLVVILDNSLSMEATDVAPNRITRAKRMITDWTRSGLFYQSAVIVYSGSAHWLTPFTRDAETLEVQLAPINPFIMPTLGNRPELAFQLLEERLKTLPDAPINILWLTDDITTAQAKEIESLLPAQANKYLAVIGTEQGSTIPLPNNNGFLTDGDTMVIVKVDRTQLYNYGQSLGFSAINLGEQPTPELLRQSKKQKTSVPNNQEIGYWLIIPIIVLFVLLLRNQAHLLFALALFTIITYPNESYAADIKHLFLNADQQAKQLLEQEHFQQALNTAQSTELIGHAAFGLGDYQRAAEAFKSLNTAAGFYNYGNSLVRQGKLKEAIEAYDQVLALGDHSNARTNKKAIADFLEQQKQTSQGSSNPQNSSNQESDESEPADSAPQPSEQGAPEQNQSSSSDADEQSETEEPTATEPEQKPGEATKAEPGSEPSEQPLNPDELRQQQQIESLLNQLESTPGFVTQQKFKYQFQQNPTQEEGTLW